MGQSDLHDTGTEPFIGLAKSDFCPKLAIASASSILACTASGNFRKSFCAALIHPTSLILDVIKFNNVWQSGFSLNAGSIKNRTGGQRSSQLESSA
jgi:hypothetical protein